MKGLWKLTWIQIKLFLREPAAFFFTLAFPTFLLLLFGAIFGRGNVAFPGQSFGAIDLMVPGYGAMVIATMGLMGIPIATASARETRVLRRFHSSPLRPITYLGADLLSNFLMALTGMFLLVLAGALLFHLRMPAAPFSLLSAFVLSAFAFFAFGYLVAAISPTSRVAQVLGNLLFFPMLFLSGAALPLEILPDFMKRIAKAIPLTYVVDLLQGCWIGRSWGEMSTDLVVIPLTGLFAVLLASRLFRWE